MSSFFSGIHTFFWHLYFFRHNVWLEKTKCESSFVFGTLIFGALLFLAQCLARKKYEFLFFGTHTFIGTMFGTKKYEFLFLGSFFFGTHTFFCWNLGNYTFFDVMFGPKPYESCPFPELLVFFAVIF